MPQWDKLLCQERLGSPVIPRSAGDVRSEFQVDRDRIIWCPQFRRLQNKAQVFPLHHHSPVRSRLTHSLEVATVARGLGLRLQRILGDKKMGPSPTGVIPDICENAALLHDIGNPPFGHAGERSLREWFKRRRTKLSDLDVYQNADYMHFEGNAQTMRILLTHGRHGRRQQQLTAATLATAMKYGASSEFLTHHQSSGKRTHFLNKLGFFQSESESIATMRKLVGLDDGLRHPLTYLVEAADDLVYVCSDIEDAMQKGLLTCKCVRDAIEACNTDLSKRILKDFEDYMSDAYPDSIVESSAREYGDALRVSLLRCAIDSIADTLSDQGILDELLAGDLPGELYEHTTCKDIVVGLKGLAKKHVYTSEEVLQLEVGGDQVLQRLADFFLDGLIAHQRDDSDARASSAIGLLGTANRRQWLESKRTEYDAVQTVCDFVSGMTDGYAVLLYRKLFVSPQ